MRRVVASLSICCVFSAQPAASMQDGVRLIGRWLPPDTAPTATYAGSTVVMRFKNSANVSADFKVSNTKFGEDLYIAVTVDGGKAVRMALSRGSHPGLVLASGLSDGVHVVEVRKEGEPNFGSLEFSQPRLDPTAKWQPVAVDRPIIEVIGDSDATGICVLGPDSPSRAVGIWRSAWASEQLSWVGRLEADLAALGHPADLVDLAISGSKTEAEAESYDYTAPGASDAKFGTYLPPGRQHASLVFLWGGGNDRHGGGDVAAKTRAGVASPIVYAELSSFQKGVYDQLKKVFARNPDVRVVLLQYIDRSLPDWKRAYEQVEGLLSDDERRRAFLLPVYVPTGKQDACEIDPKGHPNVSLHATWAAQILSWMQSKDIWPQLSFPDDNEWGDL